MRWKSDLSQKKIHKKSAVYIENSRHFLVKRVYNIFFQKQNRTKFLKLQALQQLISTCMITLPHPSLPPKKNLAKDTKYYIIGPTFGPTFLIMWTKFWANFFDAATFKVPIQCRKFSILSSSSRENSTVFRHTAFLYSPKNPLSQKKHLKMSVHQKSPIFCYYMN